jgi:uncharacterized protein YoxC
MLKEIVQTTTSLLRLAEDLQENRSELKEVRTEVRDLALAMQELRAEIRQVGEREARERAMILLRMENLLLRNQEALALPAPEAGG